MRAIRVEQFGVPEVMKPATVPEPVPGPGQVVVRLSAAGVNPVDAYIRTGTYQPDLRLPYTPGIDGAGVIAAVGSEVNHRKVGERVYVMWSASGTYAEQVLCSEFQTHPLPDRLSLAEGAAVGVPYSAAYRALFLRARAVAGETVLVHGADGAVGMAAVQFARAAGLRVIGTAGSKRGVELALAQGAHEVLDHTTPGHLQGLRELTCGCGVDVIVEMLANANLGQDLPALASGGRVVVIGSRGRVEIDPRDTMRPESAILGMSLFSATGAETASAHAAIGAGLQNGTLRPVVSREFPLAEAASAHRALLEGSSFGKFVLVP